MKLNLVCVSLNSNFEIVYELNEEELSDSEEFDDEEDRDDVDECLLLRAGDLDFGGGEFLRSARAKIRHHLINNVFFEDRHLQH